MRISDCSSDVCSSDLDEVSCRWSFLKLRAVLAASSPTFLPSRARAGNVAGRRDVFGGDHQRGNLEFGGGEPGAQRRDVFMCFDSLAGSDDVPIVVRRIKIGRAHV